MKSKPELHGSRGTRSALRSEPSPARPAWLTSSFAPRLLVIASAVSLPLPLSAAPNLVLDVTSPHDFAALRVGGSTILDITITNDGDAALNITSVTEAATAGCVHFSSPDVVDTVDPPPAMDSASLAITFNPTARGSFACDFMIASNDPDAPVFVFAVAGNGVGSELELSTSSLSFGAERVFTTSASQMFTLSNVGDPGYSLDVSSVAIAVADNDEDYVLSGFSSGTIAAGASETVFVQFQPQDTGAQNATVDILSDADVNPNDAVDCTGTGTSPEITVFQSNVNWGNVVVGTSVAGSPVTVQNDGNATLTLDAITLGGAQPSQFAITSTAPPPDILLASTETVQIQMDCAPTTVGSRSAQLQIMSDDLDEPLSTVDLSCTGVKPDITTLPAGGSTITFPDTEVGNTSPGVLVTISNAITPFTSSLNVGDVTITGTNAGDFFHDATDPYTILPNGSEMFSVFFAPTDVGFRTATLNIPSDDQETPVVSITLGGNECTAAADLVLTTVSVTDSESYEACNSITAGPDFTIYGPAGHATFDAPLVLLDNGFSVAPEGRLTVRNVIP